MLITHSHTQRTHVIYAQYAECSLWCRCNWVCPGRFFCEIRSSCSFADAIKHTHWHCSLFKDFFGWFAVMRYVLHAMDAVPTAAPHTLIYDRIDFVSIIGLSTLGQTAITAQHFSASHIHIVYCTMYVIYVRDECSIRNELEWQRNKKKKLTYCCVYRNNLLGLIMYFSWHLIRNDKFSIFFFSCLRYSHLSFIDTNFPLLIAVEFISDDGRHRENIVNSRKVMSMLLLFFCSFFVHFSFNSFIIILAKQNVKFERRKISFVVSWNKCVDAAPVFLSRR